MIKKIWGLPVALAVWLSFAGALSARPFKLAMDGPAASDHVTVVGDYHPAADPGLPVLIMLHGLDSTRHEWDSLAKKARERGWGTLAYDARGHGESRTALNGAQVDFHNPVYGKDQNFWNRMIDDALQIADHLHKMESVDYDRVALVGASLGANVALAAAEQKPELKGVVLLSPGLTYCGIRTEPPMKRWRRPALLISARPDSYATYSVHHLKKIGWNAPLETAVLAGDGPRGSHGTQLFDGHLETRILDWVGGVWLDKKRPAGKDRD